MDIKINSLDETFKIKNLIEICYFLGTRVFFEVLYSNKKEIIKLRPKDSELIGKLSNAESEQEFLKILYMSEYNNKGNISIIFFQNKYCLV